MNAGDISLKPERDVACALVDQLPSDCIVYHSYPWLKEDVPALGAMMSTNSRAALPKDLVYNLLCGTWSVWETWETIHPAFKGIDFPTEAMKSTPVPFHPGAEEFFKKWGFSLPAPLAFQK